MNIKIARSLLLPALGLVSNVVEKRQTLPILANLFINKTGNILSLVGTDLEVEMSVNIGGVDGDDGGFTVSAVKLLNITRMLPEDAILSIKKDHDNILISSGRSRYKLKSLDAEDFPRIETNNWEERFTINKDDLKSLIDKTSFSMAIQDVRYYLNGILFEIEKGVLRSIATDGHRLAQSEVNIDLDSDENRQLIIPRKAISEIIRFIDVDDKKDLTIEINKNHIKLSKGEITLISKLIDGKFPEFKSVLNTELDIVIPLKRTNFLETMNRASVLTSDKFKGVRLAVEPALLRVTANNPEQEEAVEELEITYSGEEIQTGYNITYLIDVAKVANTDTLEMCLQGNDGICVFRQPLDDKTIWLIMPMRL